MREYSRGMAFCVQFEPLEQRVLLNRSRGTSTGADVIAFAPYYHSIPQEKGWDQAGWVLIEDFTEMQGTSMEARKAYIQCVLSAPGLKGIVFVSPKNHFRLIIKLATTFYHPPWPIEIVSSVAEAFQCSDLWLQSVPDFTRGVVSSKPEAQAQGLDGVIQRLGLVTWNSPGLQSLEGISLDDPWKAFYDSLGMLKRDLDNMLASQRERRQDLQERIAKETELQDRMNTALRESQRLSKIFDEESKRHLELNKIVVETQKSTLFALGEIIESRSKETANHIRRVSEYSALLARSLGLGEKETQYILHASSMHDAGKVAIPDSILNKPGKLTNDEFDVMKGHAQKGWDLLKGSNREIMVHAATIAHQHHEKWNGKGYPQGLTGENIHLFGRITALADVFDALGSDRCYKKAWPMDQVLDLIRKERGEHFDPTLVDLFFSHLHDFMAIRERYPDAVA